MAEPPSHGASLTVLGGPCAGAAVTLDNSVPEVLIGSDPGCELALDLPGVSPLHARLVMEGGSLLVSDTRSARGVFVNDARAGENTPLSDGDVLWLGPPGQPDSVMLQCRVDIAAAGAVVPGEFFFDDPDEPTTSAPSAGEAVFGDALPDAAPNAAPQDFFLEDTPPPVEEASTPEEHVLEAPGDDAATAISFAPSAAPAAPATEDESGEDAFFVDDSEPPPAPPPVAAPERTVPPAPVASARPPIAAPAPVAAAPAPAARTAVRPPVAAPGSGSNAAIIDDTDFDPSAAMAATAPRGFAPRAAPTPPPAARKAPAAPAAARKPAARKPGLAVPRVAVFALAGVLLAAAAGFLILRLMRAPRVEAAQPSRVAAGQGLTLTGQHLGSDITQIAVRFGSTPGKVLAASGTSLNVEVPELKAVAGQDLNVPVVVAVGGRESSPVNVDVYRAPRVHGVSPNVGMPGDEVLFAGAGWGPGAKVRFGAVEAPVLDVQAAALKVRVPALDVGTGKEIRVTVTMGKDSSNPMQFVVGRLPLVTEVEPKNASSGDLVTLTGRGFDATPAANEVSIGGRPALVLSGNTTELQVVVPRNASAGGLEVRVPGHPNVGQGVLAVAPAPDPVDFRFTAEPFKDEAGHAHAVVATGLGPAFVLSDSGGKSAAQRALAAQKKLNEAAGVLRASLDAAIAARNLETAPALGFVGRPDLLLEVSGEDAEAYNEDWTRQRKGAAVTRARLALWWEAVLKDLVLLLARGERPEHSAGLAPEGRVLTEIFQSARKSVAVGVPAAVVTPGVSASLRTVALRVPASVPSGPDPSFAGGAPDGTPPLKLDGPWSGTETENAGTRYISVTFNKGSGHLTYQRALTLTVPLQGVEQARGGVVRFRLKQGAGMRYYSGRWDGKKISGTVASDPAGKVPLGTFELVSGH